MTLAEWAVHHEERRVLDQRLEEQSKQDDSYPQGEPRPSRPVDPDVNRNQRDKEGDAYGGKNRMEHQGPL